MRLNVPLPPHRRFSGVWRMFFFFFWIWIWICLFLDAYVSSCCALCLWAPRYGWVRPRCTNTDTPIPDSTLAPNKAYNGGNAENGDSEGKNSKYVHVVTTLQLQPGSSESLVPKLSNTFSGAGVAREKTKGRVCTETCQPFLLCQSECTFPPSIPHASFPRQ